MNLTLSAYIISKFPQELCNHYLPAGSAEEGFSLLREGMMADHGIPQSKVSPSINTAADRLIYPCLQIQSGEMLLAIQTIREWADRFIQELSRYPFLFYIAVTSKPPVFDMEDIDQEISTIGGPVYLIEEPVWKKNNLLKEEFEHNGITTIFNNLPCVIVREPEEDWYNKVEENMNRLLAVSGKHPLEYDIWYETAMPQDIKKERERLDSITNLPDANDRETLNPKKVEIRLQEKEKAEKASLRAYKDVPIGKNQKGGRTLGGRSLLVACNKDANLIQGWRYGKEQYRIHNAASMNFIPSVKQGSLPEAMANGRIILKKAWIQGNYQPPDLPQVDFPAETRKSQYTIYQQWLKDKKDK